ncbi:MAG: oligosaccharide flippase family protein [Chitinophagales bacterium]|nr:oligosaccharide flippase family protein [Chitinophagales bacterium]
MKIRKVVKEGVKWSIAEKIMVAVFNLIQLMIIARFVSTSDIGLMAMINTVLVFFNIFSEMGLANSVLHYQENRRSSLAALFWIYAGMGLLLTSVCFVLTPVIIYFFQEAHLEPVIKLTAISLGLSGFGLLHRTLLYKEMRFRQLSTIRIITTIISFIVTIILAIYGWGVYALVIGLLSSNLFNTIFFLLYGHSLLSLLTTPDFISIKRHFHFGAYQTAERLVNTISTQFDTLIIGRILGAEVLGGYDIIKRLLARPMRIINPIFTSIATPILASKREAIKGLYLRQILYLCSTSFPIYIFLMFSGEAIIKIVLSDVYLNPTSHTLFILFCVYFMIYTVQNPIGTVIIASGAVKRSFLYNLGIALSLPIILYFAVQGGVIDIAICMIIFQGSMIIIAQQYLLKPTADTQIEELLSCIFVPVGIGLTAFGGAYIVSLFFNICWWNLLMMGLLGGALYLGLSWFWNKQYVKELMQFIDGKSHQEVGTKVP